MSENDKDKQGQVGFQLPPLPPPPQLDTTCKVKTPPPSPNPKPEKKKMGTVGHLPLFDHSKDDFEMWVGMFEGYLIANQLDTEKKADADRAKGIFLSSIGLHSFTLLTTLLSPDEPKSKSLADLKSALKAH